MTRITQIVINGHQALAIKDQKLVLLTWEDADGPPREEVCTHARTEAEFRIALAGLDKAIGELVGDSFLAYEEWRCFGHKEQANVELRKGLNDFLSGKEW